MKLYLITPILFYTAKKVSEKALHFDMATLLIPIIAKRLDPT